MPSSLLPLAWFLALRNRFEVASRFLASALQCCCLALQCCCLGPAGASPSLRHYFAIPSPFLAAACYIPAMLLPLPGPATLLTQECSKNQFPFGAPERSPAAFSITVRLILFIFRGIGAQTPCLLLIQHHCCCYSTTSAPLLVLQEHCCCYKTTLSLIHI